jgi:ATP-dependent RNA helicase DDX46/PRP5
MDLGFEPQISRILMNIRPDRQTVMFSATFPRQIESLAKKILNKPIEVVIGNRGQTAKNIEQHIEVINRDMIFLRILELLNEYNDTKIIIFCELKEDVIELWKQLTKRKFDCVLLYGGMDQEDRIDSIEKIKNGIAKILISTSLSARGIDIKDCGLVINFNCPNHKEDYIHRIGRTGRAGKKGIAYTFIDPKNEDHLAEDIVRALEMSNQEIPEELKNVVKEYKIKLENGEAEKFRISGFLGRGYQFNNIENEKNKIERKLIGSGYDNDKYNEYNDNIQKEEEIERNKKELKLLNDNSSQALILRGKTLKEKHEEKMKNLKRDKKAQQIAMDIGNNVARAAILTGKSNNEIKIIVQNAMKKALENYKAGVSTKKGVEDATKIIEEWEKEENLKNHIFSLEFEINDYPINTRIKLTRKDYLKQLGENDNVEIIQRGVFVEPGKNTPIGQKKLYLLIKGQNQSNVNAAYSEIKRKFDESALSFYTSSFGYTGNTQRYKI